MCKFSIHFLCSWEILQAIHHSIHVPDAFFSFQISGNKKCAKQAQHPAECLTVSITIDWTEFISLQFTQIVFCFFCTNWDDESVFVETSCWTFLPLSLPLPPAYQLNKLASKLEENMKLNWVFSQFFFFLHHCVYLSAIFSNEIFIVLSWSELVFAKKVTENISRQAKKPQKVEKRYSFSELKSFLMPHVCNDATIIVL